MTRMPLASVRSTGNGRSARFGAPLHVLLSGRPDEGDRRLVVKEAPSFGLVGKEAPLTVRVEDLPSNNAGSADAKLTWRKDGGAAHIQLVPVGRDVPLSIPIDHGGPNVLELEVEPGPQELTLRASDVLIFSTKLQDADAALDAWAPTGERAPVAAKSNTKKGARYFVLREFIAPLLILRKAAAI